MLFILLFFILSILFFFVFFGTKILYNLITIFRSKNSKESFFFDKIYNILLSISYWSYILFNWFFIYFIVIFGFILFCIYFDYHYLDFNSEGKLDFLNGFYENFSYSLFNSDLEIARKSLVNHGFLNDRKSNIIIKQCYKYPLGNMLDVLGVGKLLKKNSQLQHQVTIWNYLFFNYLSTVGLNEKMQSIDEWNYFFNYSQLRVFRYTSIKFAFDFDKTQFDDLTREYQPSIFNGNAFETKYLEIQSKYMQLNADYDVLKAKKDVLETENIRLKDQMVALEADKKVVEDWCDTLEDENRILKDKKTMPKRKRKGK